MSPKPATQAEFKRLTIRMIRLQDDFRALEDQVTIIKRVLSRRAESASEPVSEE